jgi:hypothetical protein
MIRQVGYALTIVLLAGLLWQLASAQPLLSPLICGVFLVFISIMAGIRIGTDGTSNYIRDLQRVNKVLAQQNRELEEINRTLLAKVDPDSPQDA